jgi:hypothetical protein
MYTVEPGKITRIDSILDFEEWTEDDILVKITVYQGPPVKEIVLTERNF